MAGVGAVLLIVSTFGPFSFVEAAEVLVALGVLALLRQRAEGKRFHLPFGDGTVVLAAGCWAALLILVRLLDRPLGQNLLALACAGILAVAGAAERRKRPADDLPPEASAEDAGAAAETGPPEARAGPPAVAAEKVVSGEGTAAEAPTERLVSEGDG